MKKNMIDLSKKENTPYNLNKNQLGNAFIAMYKIINQQGIELDEKHEYLYYKLLNEQETSLYEMAESLEIIYIKLNN